MNNGVTIVASSVRPAGQEIFIRDFQIVNGCQTSNVLISKDIQVDESVSLMIKLIETDEPAILMTLYELRIDNLKLKMHSSFQR